MSDMTAEERADEEAINRIMAMSDEEIMADAIEEFGSEAAAKKIADLYRRWICALADAALARAAEQAAAARAREEVACWHDKQEKLSEFSAKSYFHRDSAAAIRSRSGSQG